MTIDTKKLNSNKGKTKAFTLKNAKMVFHRWDVHVHVHVVSTGHVHVHVHAVYTNLCNYGTCMDIYCWAIILIN